VGKNKKKKREPRFQNIMSDSYDSFSSDDEAARAARKRRRTGYDGRFEYLDDDEDEQEEEKDEDPLNFGRKRQHPAKQQQGHQWTDEDVEEMMSRLAREEEAGLYRKIPVAKVIRFSIFFTSSNSRKNSTLFWPKSGTSKRPSDACHQVTRRSDLNGVR
jgi:hypothetical protein